MVVAAPLPDQVRMVVVGDSGSGKTTVARRLARHLNVQHIELDALFHGKGWTPAAPDVFRERVADVAARPSWVVDGNYSDRVDDLLWPRATHIVWLDLPLSVTLPRLALRTVGRLARRVELWNGNRERLRDVIHPDHPLWWTLRRHRARRRSYEQRTDGRWIRLTTPTDIEQWLSSLGER